MYMYYAKKKREVAKTKQLDRSLAASLLDEGYYVLEAEKLYQNCSISQIEKAEGKKARKKTYRLGRRGQSKALIL